MKKTGTKAASIIQYWDANLFIDYLMDSGDKPSSRSQVFERLMKDAENKLVSVALSYLILAEVRPKNKSGVTVRKIEALLEADRPFIQWFPVSRAIAIRARRIGSACSMQAPDAIHVATAIQAKAAVLFTYDGDHGDGKVDGLLALDGKIRDTDLGNGPMKIEIPSYSDGALYPPQNYKTIDAAKAKRVSRTT